MGAIRKRYTEERVNEGLGELALCGGSPGKASGRLRERGVVIPEKTIVYWRDVSHSQRYAEISRELLPQIEDKLVGQLTGIVSAAHGVEAELIEQTREDMRAGKVRDSAGAARNMATVAGIGIDKIGDITERPKVVRVDRTIDDLWAELKQIAPDAFVEGDAEELES